MHRCVTIAKYCNCSVEIEKPCICPVAFSFTSICNVPKDIILAAPTDKFSALFTMFIFVDSFPGGKADATDSDLSHTALREADEEIGLSSEKVDVWGEMLPVPGRVSTNNMGGFCLSSNVMPLVRFHEKNSLSSVLLTFPLRETCSSCI